MEHDHEHETIKKYTPLDDKDVEETEFMRKEHKDYPAGPAKHFFRRAIDAPTKEERTYWLNRKSDAEKKAKQDAHKEKLAKKDAELAIAREELDEMVKKIRPVIVNRKLENGKSGAVFIELEGKEPEDYRITVNGVSHGKIPSWGQLLVRGLNPKLQSYVSVIISHKGLNNETPPLHFNFKDLLDSETVEQETARLLREAKLRQSQERNKHQAIIAEIKLYHENLKKKWEESAKRPIEKRIEINKKYQRGWKVRIIGLNKIPNLAPLDFNSEWEGRHLRVRWERDSAVCEKYILRGFKFDGFVDGVGKEFEFYGEPLQNELQMECWTPYGSRFVNFVPLGAALVEPYDKHKLKEDIREAEETLDILKNELVDLERKENKREKQKLPFKPPPIPTPEIIKPGKSVLLHVTCERLDNEERGRIGYAGRVYPDWLITRQGGILDEREGYLTADIIIHALYRAKGNRNHFNLGLSGVDRYSHVEINGVKNKLNHSGHYPGNPEIQTYWVNGNLMNFPTREKMLKDGLEVRLYR